MTKRILIDTDHGIDDSLAILLALASPELSLEGISVVHGNCSLEQATTNGLSILALANARHIPLAVGCELPLVQPSLLAPETHGSTGLGYAKLPEPRSRPVVQHGSDFLIEKIMSYPGEFTLVAIGPLTNVALAIRKEPRVVEALKEIVIMGGAIRHEGNTTALAEFNTYVDPHAAHIVFHAGIQTKEPFDTKADKSGTKALMTGRVAADAMQRGVYISPWYDSLVIAPPLIITEDQVDEALSALDKSLEIADQETIDTGEPVSHSTEYRK